MATPTATATKPKQDLAVEQKIQELREIFADAPQYAKTALENGLSAMMPEGWRRRHLAQKALAGSASVRAKSRS
jgi:chemotaxis receptor (MCP) glutamine deamidase CheD